MIQPPVRSSLGPAQRVLALVLTAVGVLAGPHSAGTAAASGQPAAHHAAVERGTARALSPALRRPVTYRLSAPLPRIYPVPVDAIRHRPLQRIQQLVRPELFPYFDLYLYVNKAAQGMSAQHMYIFERLPNGNFHLRRRWPASTGREQQERYFTTTPTGVYKLDPDRFLERHISKVWDGVPMPYAMFLDFAYNKGHRLSGIAIHGTNSQGHLGSRASGGCIRLAMVHARKLFYIIQDYYTGRVPKFAWDDIAGHTSRTGELRFDEEGNVVMERGFRVLLIVDNVADLAEGAAHSSRVQPQAP